MSNITNYAALDAHSRNCDACLRQRQQQGGHDHPHHHHNEGGSKRRRSSCRGEAAAAAAGAAAGVKKRLSISSSFREDQADAVRKRLSDSAVGLRRSTSSLSYADIEPRGEAAAAAASSYMTPTQRRAQEVRRLRAELARAQEAIRDRDREITGLRREVACLREAGGREEGGEAAAGGRQQQEELDAVSATDSGNCDEEDVMVRSGVDSPQPHQAAEAPAGGGRLDSIDFELMESTLREEEETRHRLEEGNRALKDELDDAKRLAEEMADRNAGLEEEVARKEEARAGLASRVEGLVQELAESTARVGRQQGLVEQAQERMERLQQEVEARREDNKQEVEARREDNKQEVEARREDLEQETQTDPRLQQQTVNMSSEPCQKRETQPPKISVDESRKTGGVGRPSRPVLVNLDASASAVVAGATAELAELSLAARADQVVGPPPPPHPSSPAVLQLTAAASADASCQTGPAEEAEGGTGVVGATCDNLNVHYTYQFLRRSVYYFLTDKDNSAYHLKSIQRLLEFTDREKLEISSRNKSSRPAQS